MEQMNQPEYPQTNSAAARAEHIGDVMVEFFHLLGLFIITLMIVWAAIVECWEIYHQGAPGIKDILLLFIYLELGVMVGIYFRTKQLPVRFLLYVAITALTRVLAIDVKEMTNERIVYISLAILLISLALLVIRIGSDRFPRGDTL